jgi:predicted PurR-regulated permease PerM
VDAARIQARAVIKVAALSLAVIAAGALLVIVILETRTTLRWLFAALFLTLALLPAVDLLEGLRIRGHQVLPRWLAILVVFVAALAFFVFLVLQVVPPIVREFEELGSKAPGWVVDFREWANQNPQFRSWAPFIAWSSGFALQFASQFASRATRLRRSPLLARLQVGAEELRRLRL